MNGTSHAFLGDLSADDLQGYAAALVANPPGTSASTDVNLFQTSYNANGGSPQIAVDGYYGPCTASALQAVLNAAPAAGGGGPTQSAPPSAFSGTCNNGAYVPPPGGGGGGASGGTSASGGTTAPIQPSSSSASAIVYGGLPNWAWWLLGAVAVASLAAVFVMSKHQKGGARHAGTHRRPMRRVRKLRRRH